MSTLTTDGHISESIRKIVDEANEVFAAVERPEHFTNHTHCCECAEHDETLQQYTPGTITREALGGAAWDPVTFSTDEGFRYYLPALIRWALTGQGDDEYIEQFLSQVIRDGRRNTRWEACKLNERAVVLKALNALLEERTEDVENSFESDRLMQAIEIWSDGGESAS